MSDEEIGWTDSQQFPLSGADPARITEILDERLAEIPDWEATRGIVRLGFGMTEPHPIAADVYGRFLRANTSNVGVHTRFGHGQTGTRRLEREALAMLGGLVHGGALDGYITSGGSEGTLAALRMARNSLRAAGASAVTVVTSELAHHSVAKAAEILDLAFQPLCVDEQHVLSIESVRDVLHEVCRRGAAVVVSTAGYFGTGLVDPIEQIARSIGELRRRNPRARVFHHVDASFGGFVLPFSDPDVRFDFRNPGVHSIVIDPHKMGLLPFGCGVLLCRKGLLEHVALEAPRAGVIDETVSGSRPGAAAAALWATITLMGRQGFAQVVRECLRQRDRLQEGIRRVDPGAVIVGHPAMNVFAVSFTFGRLPREVEERYRLVASPLASATSVDRPRPFYALYAMPSLSVDAVDRFLGEIRPSRTVARLRSGTRDIEAPELLHELRQGTACPRHVLVHPPGRRDPRQHPHNYSFHTFLSRRSTGEEFHSKTLRRARSGEPLLLYAPDLDDPFGNEVGGVMVPGRFAYEILDPHQQFLSLIGASHFFIHTSQRHSTLLANFMLDGTFRSLELKIGTDINFSDEIQVFSDRIVVKIGKDARSFYRGDDDYSFSIDTSMEITLAEARDGRTCLKRVQYNADPLLPRRRHPHRLQLRRFPNRFFGMLLEVQIAKAESGGFSLSELLRSAGSDLDLVAESAVLGLARIGISGDDADVSAGVAGLSTGAYRIDVPRGLGQSLSALLPKLPVVDPRRLSPDQVADYAESLYALLVPFANAVRPGGDLDLRRVSFGTPEVVQRTLS